MKHAKSSDSTLRANYRLLLVAMLALAFVASIIAIGNATARDTAAPATQQVHGTTGQCAVNVNGDCTVNHGLGTKPTSVVVTPANGGQQATVDPAKTNATNFTVRFLWRDGTRFKIGTVIKYNVVYTYVGTAVTPPPTTPTASPTPTSTVPADACVNPTWTSSEKLGSYNFDNTTQVNNNKWNDAAGPQTISACYWNSWYVVSNQPGDGDNDSVKTYPDTQKHVNISMANIPDINTSWKVATPSAGGVGTGKGKQWNAAYDLWLNDFDSEVMVWTNWNANWQYHYNLYGGQEVTLGGVTYAVWHKPAANGNASGIWFVRKSGVNQGSLNLRPLLEFGKTKGWIKSTDTLEHIEYGFEIMYTGEPTRFDLLDLTLNIGTVPTTTPTPTPPPTNVDYKCDPTNTVAHFYPNGTNTTGNGSDSIGDPYNASAEHWAVNDDFRSNMCVYSKDKWYVEAKSVNDGGMVQAYPSMRLIYHDWGDPNSWDRDPKISSFPQLKVEVAQTDPVDCTGCIYNDAFDIWLNGIGGDAPELMIWTHNHGQSPYGPKKASNITIDGRQWDLYNSGSYIAYVPTNGENYKSGTFDIKAFVNDLVTREIVPPDPRVGQISYGVEVVSTGTGSNPPFRRWDFTKFNVLDK